MLKQIYNLKKGASNSCNETSDEQQNVEACQQTREYQAPYLQTVMIHNCKFELGFYSYQSGKKKQLKE
jgi:hypothetical protein